MDLKEEMKGKAIREREKGVLRAVRVEIIRMATPTVEVDKKRRNRRTRHRRATGRMVSPLRAQHRYLLTSLELLLSLPFSERFWSRRG